MNTIDGTQAYETPTLKRVHPAEAAQLLVEHAARGDRGAQELLQLALPTVFEPQIDSLHCIRSVREKS